MKPVNKLEVDHIRIGSDLKDQIGIALIKWNRRNTPRMTFREFVDNAVRKELETFNK